MIWYWLMAAVRWVGRMVFPAPASYTMKRDRNAKCPVCGERSGRLRSVERLMAAGGTNVETRGVFCQHTCLKCGARFYDKPVVNVTPSHVFPAIARDEVEKREDAMMAMNPSSNRSASAAKVN